MVFVDQFVYRSKYLSICANRWTNGISGFKYFIYVCLTQYLVNKHHIQSKRGHNVVAFIFQKSLLDKGSLQKFNTHLDFIDVLKKLTCSGYGKYNCNLMSKVSEAKVNIRTNDLNKYWQVIFNLLFFPFTTVCDIDRL
ncbi:hypothetical protein C0J52_09428 [Blattella germanica]|nr:hypothetical protein C0J52_09428 [Blattella germanica]